MTEYVPVITRKTISKETFKLLGGNRGRARVVLCHCLEMGLIENLKSSFFSNDRLKAMMLC